jgi:hypothetical protein
MVWSSLAGASMRRQLEPMLPLRDAVSSITTSYLPDTSVATCMHTSPAKTADSTKNKYMTDQALLDPQRKSLHSFRTYTI